MNDELVEDAPRRFGFYLMVGVSVLFALAVARQVLPLPSLTEPQESLPDLQERLAAERSELRRKLQAELDALVQRNSEMQSEIEKLESERGAP